MAREILDDLEVRTRSSTCPSDLYLFKAAFYFIGAGVARNSVKARSLCLETVALGSIPPAKLIANAREDDDCQTNVHRDSKSWIIEAIQSIGVDHSGRFQEEISWACSYLKSLDEHWYNDHYTEFTSCLCNGNNSALLPAVWKKAVGLFEIYIQHLNSNGSNRNVPSRSRSLSRGIYIVII